MDALERDKDLAGRVEGVAQALLQLVATLEMAGVIDGSLVSARWRAAVSEQSAKSTLRQSARKALLNLAQELDAARTVRQARCD